MSGSFDDQGRLEISDGRLITLVGKKKSGKSVLAKVVFASYPGDSVVIDVAGDDGPTGDVWHGKDIVDLHGTVDDLPRKWPESKRQDDRQMILRYCPDAGSPTFLEDMDAVVGLALTHGRRQRHDGKVGCALLIHEIGVVAPAGQTKPHMRRALMHNRHNGLTVVMCGPRPQTIDPLVIQQSDLIYAFELLNPADRKRLAETMGWSPQEFDDAMGDLQRHEYLRFDANEEKPADDQDDTRLTSWPALPEDVVKAVR